MPSRKRYRHGRVPVTDVVMPTRALSGNISAMPAPLTTIAPSTLLPASAGNADDLLRSIRYSGRMSRSKNKGDGYERELAAHFNDVLHAGSPRVCRTPLSGGGRSLLGGGQADLTGTPGIWVEAKRTEAFRPLEALRQAERGIAAAQCPDSPVIINRRNRSTTGDSLVVMRLSSWMTLYRAYLLSQGYQVEDPAQVDS